MRPRVAHLLGLEDGLRGDEENLFSAWRILFERLAEKNPTVLLFEDVQWADAGLLDFIEYLLDWSRSQPLFVFALARPEFAEKRANWAGKRGFSRSTSSRLPPSAMNELLTGLVPGLPDDLRERVLDRAEGVPLYAVETVRMLLDRGLLVRDGYVYRPTGPIEQLEMPETLHALVASRLDGLGDEERHLVQDGAVLGKTFTKQGLTALTGMDATSSSRSSPRCSARRCSRSRRTRCRPERGQYAFLQDVVKRVAYETLSRKERKAKHLATAEFLLSLPGAATRTRSSRSSPLTTSMPSKQRPMPTMPGRFATAPAPCSFGQANGPRRSRPPPRRSEPSSAQPTSATTRSSRRSCTSGRGRWRERARAARKPESASSARSSSTRGRMRATRRPGSRPASPRSMWDLGRLEDGLERMDLSFELLSQDEPDADLASLAAQLGRFLFFGGQRELGKQRIEAALTMAEDLALPEVLAQA